MPEITQEELDQFKADSTAKAALEANKTRLEEESKKFKTRAQDAEGKLTDAEAAKLKADGDTQALLDIKTTENLKLKEKLDSGNKKTLKATLRTEAMKHAADAHDIDMVLKVTEHKALLKLDEENLTVEGTKEYVEKCRETHSYLFSKKRLDNGDKEKPNSKVDDDITKTEDEKYSEELRACNTRQEMNKVKKKYNKPFDY